jgi:hypothetical protein
VRTHADSRRPRQSPAHRRCGWDEDAGRRAPLALRDLDFDQNAVVQEADRQVLGLVCFGAAHAGNLQRGFVAVFCNTAAGPMSTASTSSGSAIPREHNADANA